MDNFNLYEFFNSKDIAAHCKNIGHIFTALEMAYIISRSEYPTLEQKHHNQQPVYLKNIKEK